ncbi:MAG: hypothetical protein NDI82_12140, partial [Anaeromyxobacteraceae bacterium]|nr:hypothetical protein [Anaeromyxobacteraceae bacterium]
APAPVPDPAPAATPAAAPPKAAGGISLAFGGDVYVGFQNWSRVGTSDDAKLGFGLGGALLMGIRIDDMRVLVGPHFGFSRWSADYSNKAQSATDSVYVEMKDTGLLFKAHFEDVFLQLGGGSSTIGSGMMVGGQDIKYPYDGDRYPYRLVGLGAQWDLGVVGINAVSYSGYAKYSNRFEVFFGLAI